MGRLGLFLVSFFVFNGVWAQDCSHRPVASVDCAAQILLDDGLAAKADANGWNVYQWPKLVKGKTPLFSKEVGGNVKLTPKKNSYLFWIDHEPGALFNHPSTFIYVQKATGRILMEPAQGYPIINGVEYFAQAIESLVKVYIPNGFKRHPWKGGLNLPGPVPLFKIHQIKNFLPKEFKFDNPDTPDGLIVKDKDIDWNEFKFDPEHESEPTHKRKVRGYYERPQSATQAREESTQCDCPIKTGPKQVLVISGFSKEGERDTMDSVVRYYKSLGVKVTYLRSQPNEFQEAGVRVSETHLGNIEAAFQALAARTFGCCDEVDIFLGGHGSYRGSIEMNLKGTEEVYDRYGQSYSPPRIVNIGHSDGLDLKTDKIRDLLNLVKSCQVKVYFDSCYSGIHIENGINKVDNDLIDEGCMCRAVYTSATARQVSYFSDLQNFLGELKTTRGDLAQSFLNYQSKMRTEYGDKPSAGRRNPLVQATDCISCEDTDEDGLMNGVELKDSYSDPGKKDSDDDGLDDLYEKTVTKTDPKNKDSDGDKLSDAEEVELGFDPNDDDMDDDGLSDKYEIFLGTNPKKADTDGDGLSDGAEILDFKTNANKADTDGDGLPDGYEVENGTDPKDKNSF